MIADAPSLRSQAKALLEEGVSALGELETRRLLSPEIPFGQTIECAEVEEVAAAAEEIGGPVVVKALTPKLLHKSDYGLVEAGCDTPEAAVEAARRLVERVSAAAPGEDFVLSVQRRLEGFELAMGVRRDSLGPLCMVSMGGTLIELLGDSATAMAPLDRAEAAALLRRLRVWPVLEGHRGKPGLDVESLVSLLVHLSELAVAIPEIAELDLNPVFAAPDGVGVADARCVLAAVDADGGEARGDATAALRQIFEPRRIAIVGASLDQTKVGGLVLKYLRKHGWPGEIVAVNPKGLELDGVATAKSVAAIEGPVDLACIAVPAKAVGAVIEECLATGIEAGIVFSAGFGESGEEGKAAQRELLERAGGRFRFAGPNTIGIASPAESMFATFGMVLEATEFEAGNVGLISQSGAIASSLVSRGAEFGITFSHWVSAGNEADLGVADYVEYMVDDPRTEVICLFLE
ncbi:MAG TPA: acetate--CoA ligase family protein, partial [Solirubrobacterales bacterium]